MDTLIAEVIGDIAVILIASTLLGALARRCGQPTVVGQIVAGILLGPSLLGRLPGHLTSHLFPHAALSCLNVISQVAVTLFMFVVGYEMDWGSSRRLSRPMLVVAVGSLLIPLGLGSGAAMIFRSSFVSLGQSGTGHSFILFMGVAVSITALPVLAALVRERSIAGTTAGLVATGAAGLMDVTAWLLLAAAILGTAAKQSRPLPVTIGLLIAFVAFMLLVVRPAARWWMNRPGAVLASQLPLALVLALGCGWVTVSLGLHPVFGGLLAGFALPKRDGTPDPDVLRPMEQISGALLPLFFIVTGLSVNVGSMGGTAAVVFAVLFAIASVGKLAPGYATARIGGLRRRDAATVAALVNTRGLTELLALNVGFNAGLISQQLFNILVLMAVVTTIMTAPLLRLIRPVTTEAAAAGQVGQESTASAL